ncbi:MAG TPA: sialidase, partial [Thermoanaerobaculia bacterium]|nr:sialidase [Thermoanaerobaculia bacterium]
LQSTPAVQRIFGQGGWVPGDAQFVGNNPPGDAVITYYQKKRHIFGDLKIDVLDSAGNVVGSIPSSKRRGLNRVTWSMRTKPPKVPPAASAAFGASVGPRVLPGTYAVRMTKDKNVYTTPLQVITDPRAKYSAEDRKANFDLANKLKSDITDMAYSVEQMNAIRGALDERASKLPANDATAKKLRAASDAVDTIRKKVVATKEGGMITGEERLRENITDVYGGVVFYEGRPSQTQVDRTNAIHREMADVDNDFKAWTTKELPAINSALAKKNLPPIKLMTRDEWDKSNASEAGGSPTATEERFKMFERD